jgi:hypothetical protein
VKHAVSCADLSVAGRCDGTVAIRCTEPSEGPAQMTQVDCAMLGQVCKTEPTGTVCADP